MTGNWTRGGLIVFLTFVAPIVRAQPSAEAQVSKVIASGFAALNSGDMTSYEALWDADPVLIDDMPPYLWSGAGAVKAWEAAQAAWARRNRVSAMTCSLDKTLRVEVVANRAYVVGDGGCAISSNGKRLYQKGRWSFSLSDGRSGWKVSAVSFAGEALKPLLGR